MSNLKFHILTASAIMAFGLASALPGVALAANDANSPQGSMKTNQKSNTGSVNANGAGAMRSDNSMSKPGSAKTSPQSGMNSSGSKNSDSDMESGSESMNSNGSPSKPGNGETSPKANMGNSGSGGTK